MPGPLEQQPTPSGVHVVRTVACASGRVGEVRRPLSRQLAGVAEEEIGLPSAVEALRRARLAPRCSRVQGATHRNRS